MTQKTDYNFPKPNLIPGGEISKKWVNHKQKINLVSPANKRLIDVIVIGTGLAGGSALAIDTHVLGASDLEEMDPFLWEAYYSFRPNDSIEVTPAIFGGSNVEADKDDDLFGGVITTTFKF